jgi:ketosteroid isomerase-like protein
VLTPRSPRDTALEYVDCLRTGDFDRLVTLHHPHLVCSLLGSSGVSGRYHGRDAFFAHTFKHVLGKLAATDECYVKDFRIAGADAERAALLLHGGLPTRNGGRYDQQYLQIFHVVDGLIVEIHELLDTAMVETQIFDRSFRQPRVAPAEGLRPQVSVATAPAATAAFEQRFVDAVQSSDWQALDRLLLDDVELQLAGSTPVSGVFHGRDAVKRHLSSHVDAYFTSGTMRWGAGRLVTRDKEGFCRLATIEGETKRGMAYHQILGIIGSYRGDAIAALQLYFDTAAEEAQSFDNMLSPALVVPSPEPFSIDATARTA